MAKTSQITSILYIQRAQHLTGSIQRDPHREASNSHDLKKKEENINATGGEEKSPVL